MRRDGQRRWCCHAPAIDVPAHCGRGREVLYLDRTFAHHGPGPHIWEATEGWDYVEQRLARYQTVVTAVVANRARIDGIEVFVPVRKMYEEERA